MKKLCLLIAVLLFATVAYDVRTLWVEFYCYDGQDAAAVWRAFGEPDAYTPNPVRPDVYCADWRATVTHPPVRVMFIENRVAMLNVGGVRK